jgi:hypothetical protein
VVAIQNLKQGYCRSWCLVAGGNLLEAGWQVNIIIFVAAKFMFWLFVHNDDDDNDDNDGDDDQDDDNKAINCWQQLGE